MVANVRAAHVTRLPSVKQDVGTELLLRKGAEMIHEMMGDVGGLRISVQASKMFPAFSGFRKDFF